MLAFMVLSLATAVSSEILRVNVSSELAYEPNHITAEKGDLILFRFHGERHSVSQSGGVDAPCVQLRGGFDSGIINGSDAQIGLTIEDDTRPIWFFCKQANHCQQGMAGVINAPPDLINTYIANAKLLDPIQQGVGASIDDARSDFTGLGDVTDSTVTRTFASLPSFGTVSPSTSAPISLLSNRSSSTKRTSLTGSTSTPSIFPTSASGSTSGSRAKTRVILAIVAPTAAVALAASAVLVFLRRRRRRLHRDGVAPYAVSASATQAPAASKLDPVPHTVAESEAGPTTMSELRELATEMQRAGISVRAMLSSLRAPRDDAVSDGSLPGYAP